jgi:hypothetical protein
MNKTDLPIIARKALGCLVHRNGEVIYSSHETLAQGDVYLLGLNPGGEGFITIEQHLDQMLSRTTNAFLDERFENKLGSHEPGNSPLQRRVIWLLRKLSLEPEQVCASNLIFQTSRAAEEICFGLAGICWPVHEAIIEIVRPKLLLAYGNGKQNSPYAFLKELFGKDASEEEFVAERASWKYRGFQASINQHTLYIAGLPHLSRYDPKLGGEQFIKWLRSKINIVEPTSR